MSEALQTNNLGEDASAFIQAGTPKPAIVREITRPTVKPTTEPAIEDAPAERTEAARPAKKPPREKQPEFAPNEGLISMTFRLPASLPADLIRAAADRKVRREKPWSQQEMVAEALTQWLRKNGYLSQES